MRLNPLFNSTGYQSCKQFFYLEGQMSGQAKNSSNIYQFFSHNGQGKMFHFFKLARCFLPGHVSPQWNASKTEYISTSPNASVNYSSGYTNY